MVQAACNSFAAARVSHGWYACRNNLTCLATKDMFVASLLQLKRFFYDSVLKNEYGDKLAVNL
jgi:hypothetical protein